MLAEKEPTLARALSSIDKPHIRRRAGGFEGLFRIIVEQQVSVPSAQAIWGRCQAEIDPMTPENIIDLGTDRLKLCGLSRPKARYVFGLASAVANGDLDLHEIGTLGVAGASARLQEVKGIGPWTAAIYLLFCEGHVDIWPQNDVALKHAYNAAKPRKPALSQQELDRRAARWQPYQGIAAHILWTYYAKLRSRAPI